MLKQRTDQACVWMRAGVVRYWLCNRGFDCDRCPLDAALRSRRSHVLPTLPATPRDAPTARPAGVTDPPED